LKKSLVCKLTEVRENGRHHRGPKAQEFALCSSLEICLESTWRFVVTEASTIMVWSSTKSKDQRQQNECTNNHDFNRREPELKFTKVLDSDVVDQDDSDQEDGDENTGIDSLRWTPILNDERGSCQLIRSDDDVLEPVCLTLISLEGFKYGPRDNLHIREQNQVPGRRSV
jgi:hypothetical protein